MLCWSVACVRVCVYGIHACQRITVTGNDAGSSSALHIGLFILHLFTYVYTYVECRVFNAVMYQSALHPLVPVSIDCTVMPCLEINTRRRVAGFLN